jgi:hypothetical protein
MSNNHESNVSFFFGDTLPAIRNAVRRSGNDKLVFLMFTMSKSINASSDELAAEWEENFDDVPVDHAMIEIVLIFKRRMERNFMFRWGVTRRLRRLGYFPMPA